MRMEIPMHEIVEILEGELENAVEVKDRKSLHRYVVLMVDSVVGRKEHESSTQRMHAQLDGLRSDVALIAERMEQGFVRMDERFSAVDRRFEDVNKRFAMLVGLTSTFFVILAGMMTALRIFG